MDWQDMRDAMEDARQTIKLADRHVADMATIIQGRLRQGYWQVPASVLKALKKELEGFDARTGEWK